MIKMRKRIEKRFSIVSQMAKLSSMAQATFCQPIVMMGAMGGKVVKGDWALKHSLRSQFVPFAPNR
jgi:hypothetical protein